MTTSFYNGITGLKSFQNGIDIWGHNISNINTTAYKENIPEFETIFAKNISSNPVSSDIGLGSTIHSSAKDMSEGSLVSTDNTFDIALDKEGWFEVKKGKESFYTRNGKFSRNAQGFLVNDEGAYLIVANANNITPDKDGYIINTSVNTDDLINTGTFSSISLPNNVVLPAVPTSNIKIKANLNNDNKLITPSNAEGTLYFSALYDKDGNFLNMVDDNSIAYTLGDKIIYKNGLFQKEICITDDEKDGKDVNFDFSVNGEEIKLTLPDGSRKEDIINALANEFESKGILYQKDTDSITIKSKNSLLIKSNDNIVKNAAGYLFVYKNNPLMDNEFNTINSFAQKIQDALNSIYPDKTSVSVEDGKIVINNNSNEIINTKFEKTAKNNEAFFQNVLPAGNVIMPGTAAKSYEFTANKKSFGGYIYEANGDKDTVSFEFLKKEVINGNTVWNGNISVIKNGEVLSKQSVDFIFNNEGFLISPKSVSLSTPLSITIDTDLSAFRATDSKVSYSFNQDGVAEGYLKNYNIDQKGNVYANFSNDRSVKVATIPVFHFANDQGLESIGGSLFRETSNSNKAFLYKDVKGDYIAGSFIYSHMIETSNVSLAEAMTELIITQKAFSSAAKTVTTSDEMIQRAINLKR